MDPAAEFTWRLGDREADIDVFHRAVMLIAPGGADPGLPVWVTLEDTGVPRQGAFGENTEWVTGVEILMTDLIDCPTEFTQDALALSNPDDGYIISSPTCAANGCRGHGVGE